MVRFVIPEGRTELTVSESLSLAHQKSLDSGLAPVWVEEEEVTRLSPTKTVRRVEESLMILNTFLSGRVRHGPLLWARLRARHLQPGVQVHHRG